MSDIYIKFMSDDALETMKINLNKVSKYMEDNPVKNNWISNIYSGTIFEEKKYKVPDFSLKLSERNYNEVDLENSISLYESLKHLPKYILSDERFWAWINFDKCYQQALQAMPVKENTSTVKDHYFFSQGNRRGIFFGVMSRCFFRVELTIDENLDDKYELTKFVIDNPERLRNLMWRAFSNQKHLVLGIIKAEKEMFEKYGELVSPGKLYPEVAKRVSKIGGVRLIDAIEENEIYEMTKEIILKIYKKHGLIS